jgi:uncharacterized protein DUF6011
VQNHAVAICNNFVDKSSKLAHAGVVRGCPRDRPTTGEKQMTSLQAAVSNLYSAEIDGTPDEINATIAKLNRNEYTNAHGVAVSDDDLPDFMREDYQQPKPAAVDPSQPHKIKSAKDALAFIFAGNAYFTVRSLKTGTRYTYRVSKAKNDNPMYANSGETFFVSLLTGSQNETDYSYIGMAKNRAFRTTRASRLPMTSPAVAGFAWLLYRLSLDHMPENVELWHEGRCGRCGRKLTVPESIENGIGPECMKIMGGAA